MRIVRIPNTTSLLDSRYVNVTGDTMTGALNVDIATGTEGIRLRDTSSVTKASLKWASNTITLDIPSPEPDNKLLNPTFDSDLTSWTEVPSYTLNDQFTTDRAAGAVNGTSAEPTGGTRTVTDTQSKLSITNGQLSISGGKASPTYGDPGIWYPSTSRVAGKTFVFQARYAPVGSDYSQIGYFTAQSATTANALFPIGAQTLVHEGTTGPSIVNMVGSTDYIIAIILRSAGSYYYIKGGAFTNWTLIWISSINSTTPVYPGFANYNAILTSDYLRIPTSTWLPTPLAYDTFTRADGAIGSSETTGPDSQTTPSLAWTGGAISSNKNVITPTVGSTLWDADASVFTSGTYGWVKYGNNTIANVSNALVITYIDNPTGAYEYLRNTKDLSSDLTVGQWYEFLSSTNVNAGSSMKLRIDTGLGNVIFSSSITSTTPITVPIAFRAAHITDAYLAVSDMGTGETITLDDLSLKPLTLSSLFSSVSTSDKDVVASADVVMTTGTQAGVVTNLDSASSPANFLIAYHDGTNMHLDKNVAGTYTSLINTAATYSSGATLRVITYHSDASTLKVRVFYNNALVGSEQTVTNAGIISNTLHGLFSTYSGNTFDNFTLFARGSDGEYASAPFEELTPTRDTTTKYAGAASAKLVAGGTDANYLQSVTLPDTSTYTLIAYAYTTGAAVTTTDLDLYYDTDVLATTFASVGGGWYSLTGTLTGVASAKNYGVRVHAGKTVYVDSFSLQAGTGVTTTFEMLNSGTGNLHHTVEGTSTLNAGVATEQALIVKGAASQTEDILEIQDSTGTVLLNIQPDGDLEFPAGKNIVLQTTTGTKIGTATTQLLGFYNATPVDQPAALTAGLTTITYTEPGTPDYAIQNLTTTTPYGFVTANEGQSVLKVIANLQTKVAEIEARLEELGLVAVN